MNGLLKSSLILSLSWANASLAVNLGSVEQNPDAAFYEELAGRLGCDAAAQWLVLPPSGASDFISTLTTMKADATSRDGQEDRAHSWYSLTKKNLFDQKKIVSLCNPYTRVRTLWDGLNDISSLAPEGVTIVALGGFGSHTAADGTLTTSYLEWKTRRNDLFESGRVRFLRVECSFSYSPDETFCAKDMLTTLEKLDRESPKPGKHKFLLWGYSKGGISALEMLRLSPSLRARTMAVVNVGTPIRGAMVMDRLAPALDTFVASSRLPGTDETLGADTILKMLQMWVGGARTDIDEIMKNFSKFREGAHALTSKNRARYLAGALTPNAYLRPNGSKIDIFQVSGVVDPSRLESLPILKVKGGKLVAEEGSSDSLHTAQLAALVAAAEHPLSDSCVALEESLLPVKEAKIAGLNPQLLAVLRMDHLSLRFHRMSSEGKYGVPDHAIVDALLSTVAKRIKP